MGGQLIKGYSLEGDSQGVVGLTKAWKLYRGHKAQTHALSSIFLIEKKQLKKAEKDQTIKMAKKQAGSLLRVRHPGVLAVLQPLTEDENILAFVTERAEGTMSQLIKNGKISQFINSELELKLYLYPFLETIAFIHESLKQAHLAISPESIFLAPDGKWKLAGFGINQQLTSDQKLPTEQKIYDYSYSAPQLASGSFTKRSDIFSLGVLVIRLMEFLHKEGKALIIPDKSSYDKLSGQLKKLIGSSVVNKSTNVGQFQQFLRGVLEWEESRRLNVSQLLSSKWLNDSTLITVKYLDKISSYENKQQLQFLKGLAGVLDDFQIRVISRIILPKLLELLKFGHLIASVVYIIVDLLKKVRITGQLFNKVAWPALKVITQGKQMTAQAIFIFVLNYEILQKYVGESESNMFLLPLYIKCYDCPPKLKQLALKNLERLAKKLDYQSLKNRVLPKLLAVLKDPLIDIRKDSLRALYSILKILDSQTISMSVLPAIQAARKAGSDPFINSIINTIYNNLAANLPYEIISSKILPVLIPYLSEPSISKNEFKQFKTTILNMIARVEKERQKTFDNSISAQEVQFTEADYKFKEQEVKNVTEVKGNYSFLANYIQIKKEPTNPVQAPPVPVEQIKQDLSFNIPTNIPRNLETNNNNNQNHQIISQQLPLSIKTQPKPQPQSNPIPSYLPPEIKQPVNIQNSSNFPIKLQFPEPSTANDTDFDFGGNSGNYQPLKMDFSALDITSNNTKLEPVKIAPVVPVVAQKKPEIPMKPLVPPTSNLQKKSSNEAKKQVKAFGGTSGPLQIKKIAPIGKPKPPVESPKKQPTKQQITPSLNLDYFSNPAPKTNSTNFSLNFDSLGGFGLNNSPTISMPFTKKQQSKPLQSSFSFTPPPIQASNIDSNNPFAQIQSSLPITPAQNDDIYSYFQDSSKFKGGPSGMDLI